MIPVSVVIPTHERRDLVMESVRHLMSQDYPDGLLQIIVVVDRGRDGTGKALAAEFGSRVLVIASPRAGSSPALNAGISRAQGDIVITLDDDMKPSPGFVRAHVEAHTAGRATRVSVTGYSPVVLPSASTSLDRYVAANFAKFHAALAADDRKDSPGNVNAGNFSMKKSDLCAVGCFNEEYVFQRNDFELGTRLIEAGFEIRFATNARADQSIAVTSDGIVSRAEPRAAADVRLAREHPWCVEFLPFSSRLDSGPERGRWHAIWRGRHIIPGVFGAARKVAPDALPLVRNEYGARYAVATIRAAGGWDEFQRLGAL